MECRHHRAGDRVLHVRVDVDHVNRFQLEPAEGLQGQPSAWQRNVHGAGGQEQGRVRWRRDRGAKVGGQHDDVANLRAEPVAVPAGADGRLVERSDPKASAVHDVAAVRGIDPKLGPNAVRVLLLSAAHGSGRNRRDHTDSTDRWSDHDDHDRLQLHRRRHFGS